MRNFNRIICFTFICFILFSCTEIEKGELQKEVLFKLNIGKGEDQVDLINYFDMASEVKNNLYMKNGLLYIGNGNSRKIMEFSGYGDIISLYYDDSINPPPILLSTNEDSKSTKKAYKYPFNYVGEFAVDSTKKLYVEEKVPPNRIEIDEESGELYDSIILCFDSDGKFAYYLGQGGIGTTPFGSILSIDITVNDEVCVTRKSIDSYFIYWFDSNGKLMSYIQLPIQELPAPKDAQTTAHLDKIIADPYMRVVYLKIDYSLALVTDETEKKNSFLSRIYELNIETLEYDNFIEIQIENTDPDYKEDDYPIYELLGVAGNGNFFLGNRFDDQIMKLLIINKSEKVLARAKIRFNSGDVKFHKFYVNSDGGLVGMLGKEYEVELANWRTDKFVKVGSGKTR